jgi:hypothetical protein
MVWPKHDSTTKLTIPNRESNVYFPKNPFFFGGSGTSSAKNRSDELSSRTYQKYCAIGIMKEPTTRMDSKAVYLPKKSDRGMGLS